MIKLKGMSDSILRCIVPEDIPQSELMDAFGEIREKCGGILADARIVLDFGARALTEAHISRLLSDFVWPSGAAVAAWVTYDASSQVVLKRAGLCSSEPSRDDGGGCSALLLHRSLRSGQRVEHRGDVIIAGHVNDGGEVLASGNVTVLGRLSGLVHAGYEGDEDTAVVARSMEALQVRVGSKIGSLDRDAKWWGRPVIVSVREDLVYIDFWPPVKFANASVAYREDTV
jgi:septum site-determining protein MinC